MVMRYGNLADAAMGDLRCAESVSERSQPGPFSPVARLLLGLALALVALTSLAILSETSERVAMAVPSIADLERWLVWGDARPF